MIIKNTWFNRRNFQLKNQEDDLTFVYKNEKFGSLNSSYRRYVVHGTHLYIDETFTRLTVYKRSFKI